jgi:hypothetical protein
MPEAERLRASGRVLARSTSSNASSNEVAKQEHRPIGGAIAPAVCPWCRKPPDQRFRHVPAARTGFLWTLLCEGSDHRVVVRGRTLDSAIRNWDRGALRWRP